MLLFSFLGVLLYCVYEFIINSIYKMSNDELPDNTAADRCIMRKSSERKSAWRVEERQAISWSCQHTEECYSPIDRNRSGMISDVMGYQSYKPISTLLVTSRLDTTRHVRRVEPMHFACVELVKQHGSMRSTRRTCRVMSWRAKWNLGDLQKMVKIVSWVSSKPAVMQSMVVVVVWLY